MFNNRTSILHFQCRPHYHFKESKNQMLFYCLFVFFFPIISVQFPKFVSTKNLSTSFQVKLLYISKVKEKCILCNNILTAQSLVLGVIFIFKSVLLILKYGLRLLSTCMFCAHVTRVHFVLTCSACLLCIYVYGVTFCLNRLHMHIPHLYIAHAHSELTRAFCMNTQHSHPACPCSVHTSCVVPFEPSFFKCQVITSSGRCDMMIVAFLVLISLQLLLFIVVSFQASFRACLPVFADNQNQFNYGKITNSHIILSIFVKTAALLICV